jgi:hypothetical protein
MDSNLNNIKSALEIRLPEIDNYAALRTYTGSQTSFRVKGANTIIDGGEGVSP